LWKGQERQDRCYAISGNLSFSLGCAIYEVLATLSSEVAAHFMLSRWHMELREIEMRRGISCLLIVCIATPAVAVYPTIRTPSIQLENARNVWFKRYSCPPPKPSAYKRRQGVMTFTLENGDVGTCGNDDKPKKATNMPVPYVERSEVSGESQKQGDRFLFSALVHFSPNFTSANQTTFFQVHQWSSKNCQCAPYVRLMLDNDGQLYAWVLKGHYRFEHYRLGNWKRSNFEDQWVEIAVDIDTSENRSVSVYIGGKPLLTTNVHVQDGGTVFAKAGLYRPGSNKITLPSDKVHVRDMKFSRLKVL